MVRTFRQDPVPRAVLGHVMRSVLHAPSAGFTQGNEFLVLDQPATVDDFFRITDTNERDPVVPAEGRPPVVVLPLSHKHAYLDRYAQPDKIEFGLDDETAWAVPYWDVDAGMAAMLILLAAIDQGLGAWFSGIVTGEAAVLEHFGVPSRLRPIGFIGLGYAADSDPAAARASSATRRKRSFAELVHFNAWPSS
jgi:nitroreductase